MTDHLANSWQSLVGSEVDGDPIVALSWLHNGVKLALHVEKVSDRVLCLYIPDLFYLMVFCASSFHFSFTSPEFLVLEKNSLV